MANYPICGATARSTGQPCRRPAGWGTNHPGAGRCKLHGGATPSGPASPHYVHGERCRPRPMPPISVDQAEVEEFLERFDLLDLDRSVGVLAYITEKLLEYPRLVECPQCSHLVPTPAPTQTYLRATGILVRAQVAILQLQDRIVIERIIADDALLQTLDRLAEVLHKEIDDEQLVIRIIARMSGLTQGRWGDED